MTKKKYLAGSYRRNKKVIKQRSREWFKNNKNRAAAVHHDYYLAHKEEILKRSAEYQSTHKDAHKRSAHKCHLKRMYNITPEMFEEMFKEQGHECAICGNTDSQANGRARQGFSRGWAIDHDHSCCPGRKSCGECIRGILCVKCNWALGCFDDSIHKMKSAIAYLEGAVA